MSKKTDIMAALSPLVESKTKEVHIGETVITVNIKPFLTPKMRAAIVNEVSQRVYDGEGRNYGLVDCVFRSAVVKVCTDFKVTLDGGMEAALLYGTDLYDAVQSVVGYGVLGEVKDSCFEQIRAAIDTELVLMQAMTQSNPFDRIADEIQGLISGLRNVVTNIDVNTAKELLAGTVDEGVVDNLVTGLFDNREGDDDGTSDTDEQADLGGTDETD